MWKESNKYQEWNSNSIESVNTFYSHFWFYSRLLFSGFVCVCACLSDVPKLLSPWNKLVNGGRASPNFLVIEWDEFRRARETLSCVRGLTFNNHYYYCYRRCVSKAHFMCGAPWFLRKHYSSDPATPIILNFNPLCVCVPSHLAEVHISVKKWNDIGGPAQMNICMRQRSSVFSFIVLVMWRPFKANTSSSYARIRSLTHVHSCCDFAFFFFFSFSIECAFWNWRDMLRMCATRTWHINENDGSQRAQIKYLEKRKCQEIQAAACR